MGDANERLELITAATRRLERAELELAAALAALPNIERADKQMVTARMRRALDEIVAAKAALVGLLDEQASGGNSGADPQPQTPDDAMDD